jgi:hypothetical protein
LEVSRRSDFTVTFVTDPKLATNLDETHTLGYATDVSFGTVQVMIALVLENVGWITFNHSLQVPPSFSPVLATIKHVR